MLTEVLRERLRLRRYTRCTEEACIGWNRDFIRFHKRRHPWQSDWDVFSFLAGKRPVDQTPFPNSGAGRDSTTFQPDLQQRLHRLGHSQEPEVGRVSSIHRALAVRPQ